MNAGPVPGARQAVVEIGKGEYSFCAAHAGWHPGGFEPLHGHTFIVTLRLAGDVDEMGAVSEFGAVKAALRAVIAPLRRRTLLAAGAPAAPVEVTGGQAMFGLAGLRYVLPERDVVLLPIVNSTTEAIAAYLLGELAERLRHPGLAWAELTLAEAPDVAATVRAQLR